MENLEKSISIDDELIVRYLTGEANPEEAMAIHLWIEATENRLYFESFESTWNKTRSSKAMQIPNTQRAWSSIQTKRKGADSSQPQGSQIYLNRSAVLRIAASLLIISILSLIYLSANKSEQVIQVMVANNGITEQVEFADKSIAILNAHATIAYPKDFDKKVRTVELTEGEAFFKITENRNRPFVVHTRLGDVRVVGTEFNVSLEQNELVVSVISGKVVVLTKKDSNRLEAGFSGKVQSDQQKIVVAKIENANDLAYATHSFVFRDISLNEVFRDIEKSYSYFVDVQNKDIENCKLTATFENATADKMLALIAETLNLTVTKNGNRFTIEGKGCP